MFIGVFGQAQPAEPEPERDAEEFKARLKLTSHIAPDLQTQFEALLDFIWRSEKEQDFQRKIDNAALIEELKEKRRKK